MRLWPTFLDISLGSVLHTAAQRCTYIFESSHAKWPACEQIKGHPWQQFGPVPWLHYRQLQRSLIRIPAGQRSRTSSSPAKGAHLSERLGDHRPTNLPRLPDCRALCLHIKDKKNRAGESEGEREREKTRERAAILFRDGLLFKPPERALFKTPISLGEGDYKQIKLHSLWYLIS